MSDQIDKHRNHGRANEDDEPEESDCECRGTAEQSVCAEAGCGFCRAAQRHR